MQVSAVSAPFTAESSQHRQSALSQSFGKRAPLTEEELNEVAFRVSVRQAKKRQKNTRRLFLAVPVVAALTAGILHTGGSKVLNKEISGAAGKVVEGIKSGSGWAYLLGLASAIGLGEAALSKKSDKYNEFRRNHLGVSFFADVVAFFALSMAIPAGISKLASKIKPQHLETFANGIENAASHFNSFMKTPKFVKNMGETVSKWIPEGVKSAKKSVADAIPKVAKDMWSGTKEIGKVLLSLAPTATFLTALFTDMTGHIRFYNDYSNNYNKLKSRTGVKEV